MPECKRGPPAAAPAILVQAAAQRVGGGIDIIDTSLRRIRGEIEVLATHVADRDLVLGCERGLDRGQTQVRAELVPVPVDPTPENAATAPGAGIRAVAETGLVALGPGRRSHNLDRHALALCPVSLNRHFRLTEIGGVGQRQLKIGQPARLEGLAGLDRNELVHERRRQDALLDGDVAEKKARSRIQNQLDIRHLLLWINRDAAAPVTAVQVAERIGVIAQSTLEVVINRVRQPLARRDRRVVYQAPKPGLIAALALDGYRHLAQARCRPGVDHVCRSPGRIVAVQGGGDVRRVIPEGLQRGLYLGSCRLVQAADGLFRQLAFGQPALAVSRPENAEVCLDIGAIS